MTLLREREAERVERMRRMQRANLEKRTGTKLSPPPGAELRLDVLTLRKVEQRQAGEPIGFKGLAALFDQRTLIGSAGWGFFEEIAPGAFAETIVEDDIRMVLNHDDSKPLARNKTEPPSLRLEEIDEGLGVDADMDPTSYALDLAISLERGTVSQMSFAFKALDVEWVILDDDDEDKGVVMEPELRIVKRVKLWEVSPVTFPAYNDTEAALRSAVADQICRQDADEDLVRSLLERFQVPTTAPTGVTTPPVDGASRYGMQVRDGARPITVAVRRARMKAREHGLDVVA